MRVLIVGGTSFVGRAISWSAWHHGHAVTVLNRGVTPSDLPESVEHLTGDRQGDLSALHDRSFDATIDVTAYRPRDVERLADALDARGGHYLQVSSVSAYQSPHDEGAVESTLTLHETAGLDAASPISAATYGPLKAASERAGVDLFGPVVTVVRPTYVVGSHDATLRFPYWVERLRRGGDVAIPGPRTHALQYIDARDLANFVVRLVDDGRAGACHVTGPRPGERFVAVLESIAAQVAPAGTRLREIAPAQVTAAGLGDKFPLWSGPEDETLLALESALALSYGLDLRPLEDSVNDVVEWWGERAWPEHWLDPSDEQRLLALLDR